MWPLNGKKQNFSKFVGFNPKKEFLRVARYYVIILRPAVNFTNILRAAFMYVSCKLRAQLFCAYVLGLYFTGVSQPVQTLRVECWWNWPQIS